MSDLLEKIADAIIQAQCPDREGPFGLYDYSSYQRPRFTIRDFRDPSPERYGAVIESFTCKAEARTVYDRRTRLHIASAAAMALREPSTQMLEAGERAEGSLKDRWKAMIDTLIREGCI